MRKPFIMGNWKMFKTIKEAVAFAEDFKKSISGLDVIAGVCAPILSGRIEGSLQGYGYKGWRTEYAFR